MSSALWVSKTGLAAQDVKMTAIANNLANVNTTGFKRDRVAFSDLFYDIQRQPGAQADQQNEVPSGIQLGNGVRVLGTQKVFTTGNFANTGQELDIAIVGKGFFQVEQPTGEIAYTRNGQFSLNSNAEIVNGDGLPLVPNMQLPENTLSLTVGSDGVVSVTLAGDANPVEIGQISLVNFANPAGLEAKGGNLYLATGSSGEPLEGVAGEDSLGVLKQGTLEGSNVSVVEEMVDMISTQRAYEMNAKVVSASDQMLKFISQSL
ncbi:flagellar basal-body rod protein FlgG [Thalassotalea sp. PLHSN55]|uniref:flagellar basal-body rod protein FlgG n=1 Tax=Thalassotalea sp. PLHSN55 TaxID=3435888 RepID=UPI003F867C24